MFRTNYFVSRNLSCVYTLFWGALPLLNSCYNELGTSFGIVATIVALLRVAVHHLLPPGAAHVLMLFVIGFVPALSVFGMLAFLRSFTFSWRLSTEGHTTVPGLWAVCQYNSSPEVHLVAWQTISFRLPVQEFLLGLTMAATFHAHPFIVACDVVLQAGIIGLGLGLGLTLTLTLPLPLTLTLTLTRRASPCSSSSRRASCSTSTSRPSRA